MQDAASILPIIFQKCEKVPPNCILNYPRCNLQYSWKTNENTLAPSSRFLEQNNNVASYNFGSELTKTV